MFLLTNNTNNQLGPYNGQLIAANNFITINSNAAAYIADGTLLADVINENISITYAGKQLSGSSGAALLLQLGQLSNVDSNGNLYTSTNSQPPYGAKTILINGSSKKLFARFTGIQFSLQQGSNTLVYTNPYPWAKIIGVEVVNCEALDTADLKVYDTSSGTYSGIPNALLNQFSYSLNLSKDFYQRMAQFDADIYQGMVIQIIYTSQNAKTVGINLLLDEVK
jgi:hypothetical protein